MKLTSLDPEVTWSRLEINLILLKWLDWNVTNLSLVTWNQLGAKNIPFGIWICLANYAYLLKLQKSLPLIVQKIEYGINYKYSEYITIVKIDSAASTAPN